MAELTLNNSKDIINNKILGYFHSNNMGNVMLNISKDINNNIILGHFHSNNMVNE